jgi:hypothetical protein
VADKPNHTGSVDAWMDEVAKGAAAADLIRHFESAFRALWRRADTTLGNVTMMAIVDRVLYTAKERFPALAGLELQPEGIDAKALLDGGRELDGAELAAGVRFILIEFLTVLGKLTAEILTLALHDELARIIATAAADETAKAKQKTTFRDPNDAGDGESVH